MGGNAEVRDSSGRCPKSWRIERSAGKLVVPLDSPGMVLELPFRLRRLPLNGLMLSLAHHSDCYDECEVTVAVNGHVLATVTEDVADGGTGTSLANDSAVVHSVHVPSPVLKHGELAPGNAQRPRPAETRWPFAPRNRRLRSID